MFVCCLTELSDRCSAALFILRFFGIRIASACAEPRGLCVTPNSGLCSLFTVPSAARAVHPDGAVRRQDCPPAGAMRARGARRRVLLAPLAALERHASRAHPVHAAFAVRLRLLIVFTFTFSSHLRALVHVQFSG